MNVQSETGLTDKELRELRGLYRAYHVTDCYGAKDIVRLTELEARATTAQMDKLVEEFPQVIHYLKKVT